MESNQDQGPGSGAVPVSVVIPTKDEERNIEACIASVAWADEIIVFDSYSTDQTLALAEKCGARIVQRKFDTFAVHKNWALENIDFRHDWILLLDADERITDPLAAEIREAVADADGPAGWYIARRNMFCGKWMRHGGVYPDYNLRLLRRGKAHYEDRVVHEHMILDGEAGYFKNHLLHEDDKGIERYFDRHNHYTTLEAVEILRARNRNTGERLGGSLWSTGPERRRWLKNFAQRYLPFRPVFVFLYMYFLKLGILDGRMGLRYCLLKMFFEYQIEIKVKELEIPGSPLRRKYAEFLD